MLYEDLAKRFNGHKEMGCYRAQCPVHEDGRRYGRGLAVYAKDDRSILVCYAGCRSDDILAAVGLTWKDCLYQQKDSKEWRAEQRRLQEQEKADYRARIRNLIILFKNEGYATYERDRDVSLAVAQIMAVEGSKPHLVAILSRSMERLIAAQFCH